MQSMNNLLKVGDTIIPVHDVYTKCYTLGVPLVITEVKSLNGNDTQLTYMVDGLQFFFVDEEGEYWIRGKKKRKNIG